jgi:hypothetical protein
MVLTIARDVSEGLMTEQYDDNHGEDRSEEQERLAREIADELADAFVGYVRGDLDFAELSFGVYDALRDLDVIASGEYELTDDEDDDDEVYDDDEAVEEQEELSQEPAT